MKFCNRSPFDLAVGDRFLMGHTTTGFVGKRWCHVPVFQVCTVTRAGRDFDAVDEHGNSIRARDGGKTWVTREGLYAEERAPDGHVRERLRGSFLWTNLLPEGTPDQIKDFALPLHVSDHSGGFVLHVESVDGTVATAALVSPAGQVLPVGGDLPAEEDDGAAWSGATVGNAAFWDRPILIQDDVVGSWRAGDLVTASGISCWETDGTTLARLETHRVVGNFATREAVGAFMPWGSVPADEARPHRYWGNLYSRHEDYLQEAYFAHLRTQPDEALVIWHRDGEEDACRFLGQSGIELELFEDAQAHVSYYKPQEPGLYLFHDVEHWTTTSHEGEHDAGLDGKWRAATVEDLERFGFSPADLDHEIREALELDGPAPGIALEYIAMAERALSAPGAAP